MQIVHRVAAMAVAALVVTTACGKKDAAATDSAAMAMKAESAAATMAPPPAPAMTDANIVYVLDMANMADSARGAMAGSKATDKSVHDFGHLMMGEHHALRQDGQTLATKLGVTPAMPVGDQSESAAAQEMSTLESTAKGAAWDKAYIDYEVTYHQNVLTTATAALGAAQNQELKDLITKAAPVIQKHLDMALDIQKKLKP